MLAGSPDHRSSPGGSVTIPPMPSRVPTGATPEGDGIVLGDGPVRVDAFIDFLCPYCRRFELSSGPALATIAAAARAYAATLSWPEIALRTKNEMASLLGLTSEAGASAEPCSTPEAARAGRR